jgi:phage terminase small subunit
VKKVTKGRGKLTEKQKAFCIYYCKNGWNGTQAAISAGYSQHVARDIACENLTKPNIQAEVGRLKGNLEEVCQISKGMVIQEHRKLAFSSIAHLHDTWIERKAFDQLTDDHKACIAEISTQIRHVAGIDASGEMTSVEVEFVKIKLYDKQKALDAITKIMGYDAPIKAELSGSLEIHQITGMKVE